VTKNLPSEWAPIPARFEIGYKVEATPTSIIAKLPVVKQGHDETVNNYFSRAKYFYGNSKQTSTQQPLTSPMSLFQQQ
jgi:UTP-glucose-1-phosphate uridylyltransferase